MTDSDLDAISDSFEDFPDQDQETGSPDDELDEIGNGSTDADEQPETEAEGETPEGGDADADEAGSEDQVRVTLNDGSEVTLAELKDGYFREQDYTHKTTEVAEERKRIAETQAAYADRANFVETTLTNLTAYLERLVPADPPLSLAQTDPGAYQMQKAMRDNAIAELSQLVQMKDGLGRAQQGFNQEDVARLKGDEEAKLLRAMPHLADPAKRAAFDRRTKELALESGFTEAEFDAQPVLDHRLVQLIHEAADGRRARQNRANAKRRAEAPKKGKARPAHVAGGASGNRRAKERLSKTGSIEDAMEIDFD